MITSESEKEKKEEKHNNPKRKKKERKIARFLEKLDLKIGEIQS